jgi:hypothetical protein
MGCNGKNEKSEADKDLPATSIRQAATSNIKKIPSHNYYRRQIPKMTQTKNKTINTTRKISCAQKYSTNIRERKLKGNNSFCFIN